MEVTAKFQIPEKEVLHRLAEATELAGFPISAGRVQNISDTYLDTSRWRVLAAGYACRLRIGDDRVLITLKQLRTADGVVHRREEFEVELSEYAPPADWPVSPARSKVLEIIGDQPLTEALDLRQVRVVRLVASEENPVAELSLDEVYLGGSDVSDDVHTSDEAETRSTDAAEAPRADAGARGARAQAPGGPVSPADDEADTHFYEAASSRLAVRNAT